MADEWLIEEWGGKVAEDTSHIGEDDSI